MKIISVELHTRQPEELKAFYTETLGLPLLSEEQQAFSVQVGHSTLTFRTNLERPVGGYHLAFNLPGNRIGEAGEWLQDRVAFLYAPGSTSPVVYHEAWQAQALYFYDPELNLLEFISHRTASASLAPFGPEQLIGVAEVGLPVRDVASFAQELREKLQLPRWKPANALFEAAGGPEGMLIVVQEQRPWFPTQNPAQALPLRLSVQAPGKGRIEHSLFEISPAAATPQV